MAQPNVQSLAALFKPELATFEREGIHFFVDGHSPNWIATDARGARILDWVDGTKSREEIERLYAGAFRAETGQAWRDVQYFLEKATRAGLVLSGMSASGMTSPSPYSGRSSHLEPQALKEFWIHLLQTCNLSCTHCLVSSNPKGEKGQSYEFLTGAIDQAHALGARRVYFTGGEPFVRQDLIDLIRYVTEEKKSGVDRDDERDPRHRRTPGGA